jgi:hypothetical protein
VNTEPTGEYGRRLFLREYDYMVMVRVYGYG